MRHGHFISRFCRKHIKKAFLCIENLNPQVTRSIHSSQIFWIFEGGLRGFLKIWESSSPKKSAPVAGFSLLCKFYSLYKFNTSIVFVSKVFLDSKSTFSILQSGFIILKKSRSIQKNNFPCLKNFRIEGGIEPVIQGSIRFSRLLKQSLSKICKKIYPRLQQQNHISTVTSVLK